MCLQNQHTSQKTVGRYGRLMGLLSVLLLTLWGGQIQAASGQGGRFYEAWIPVTDQSDASRQAGFQRGLDIVLQRVTGRAQVSSVSEFTDIREQAGNLVSQFNYREQPEVDRKQPWQRYLLQVSFNEVALNDLLRKKGLAIWGAGRPPVLVWITREQAGHREIVGGSQFSVIRDSLDYASNEWGVPLIYPLMDFEDAGALAVSDLWGLFADPIQQASKRYGVNTVLAVRVWPSMAGEGLFNARSLFLFQRQTISSDFRDIAPEELAERLLSTVAGQMAGYYAVTADGSPGRPVRISVDGIDTVSIYANLIRYFEDLTAVRQVMPIHVSGSKVLLEVTIDGSMEQLRAIIDLERKLVASSPSIQDGVGQEVNAMQWLSDFDYRWYQ